MKRKSPVLLQWTSSLSIFNYNKFHIDKLIKLFKIYNRHANKLQETGSKLNLFYSTPSCYTKAVNEQDVIWPPKTDDFFPLASSSPFDPFDIEYWTGFYTSRPALKSLVRQGSNLLQV